MVQNFSHISLNAILFCKEGCLAIMRKTFKTLILTAAASAVLLCSCAAENKETVKSTDDLKALYNCTLIDGTGAPAMENSMILIRNQDIEKIVQGKGTPVPDGYKKIDLSGYTVLPGFINSHVHCFYSEEALQYWLKHGVTTVRELAARDGTNFEEVRNSCNKNPKNARLVTATPFITKPGGYAPAYSAPINSPEEAEKKTNELLKMKPDVIKISLEDDLQGRKWNIMNVNEIKSITNTAHKQNKRVTAHISHVRNLRLALDGGVDELAHMVVEPVSDEQISEIVRHNIWWVPTLELWSGVSKMYKMTWDKTAIQNLSKFYKAGGKIALGTDRGGYSTEFDRGMPMTEMKLMKEAGMTNMDIIVSATKNGAYVCGMADRLGTLESGKIADIIAVKGNPLENLDSLENLHMVIHNGEVVS
jgi:imidazolonepropionase-like amidohydrolase